MEHFDLIVIGSGPGGYVAAIRAAQLKMKVACVEKSATLGGTCLNIGCIPSKTLLHSSEYYYKISKQGKEHGINFDGLSIDWTQMLNRKNNVVEGLVKGVDGLFKKNQITRFLGTATLKDPQTVIVDNNGQKTELTGKNILLATGSEPIQLPFLPFDEEVIVSSTGALRLPSIPKKMLIIGAGIIGMELGSVYARLGSEIEVVEMLDRICPVFDRGISKALLPIFQKQGLKFHLSSKVLSGKRTDQGVEITIQQSDGKEALLKADIVLVAIGRTPYSKGLGLEDLGIVKDSKGFVAIDAFFRTNHQNIYAIGDLVEGAMLAHKASEEGVVAVEIMSGQPTQMNYMVIPNVMYTWPEVASVGFSEEEAKESGLEIKIGQFPFRANPRARCSGDEEGFVKLIAEARTQRIIGAHLMGPNVSEMIGEISMAIEKRATASDLAKLSHAHPTCSEAIKEAALAICQHPIHI